MTPVDKLRLIRTDAMEWLKGVRTLDEVDRKRPVKPFPVKLLYVKLYVRLWVLYIRFLCPKSRRMKMTWLNVALFLWDTMFNIGRHTAFVSKKEEDANVLIQRAVFILKNLDPDVIPLELLPRWTDKYCELNFPEIDSKIHAYPTGADQLRQHTLSGVLCDELAFWPDAEDMYAGSKPTLEGGGRFVGLSSAGPGFFKRMVFDQLDAKKEAVDETNQVMGADIHTPIPGVKVWRNPKNRYVVMEIHYTADPAKRSKEWKDRESADMPRSKWDQEYEIQWESFAGKPVYQKDYDGKIHLVHGPIDPHVGLPLLRGWDFGLTPSAVVCQLRGEEFVTIKEFIGDNIGVKAFKPIVIRLCFTLFKGWFDLEKNWFDFADPSGVARADTDESSCFRILASKPYKLHVIPGAVPFTERRDSVVDLLARTYMGEKGRCPVFQISSTGCPVLVRGFAGGYRFPEESFKIEPQKVRPIKDQFSHPQDALQMITSRIMNVSRRYRNIPDAQYGAKSGTRRDPYGRPI